MDNRENRLPMDGEERKRASTTRSGRSYQVHPDPSREEQGRGTLPSPSSMESDIIDEEEEDDESSSSEYIDFGHEYFESQGTLNNDDLIFFEGLESQDSNSTGDEIDEDDIDPDELSYEELLALGEFIGQEKRGLSMEAISTCLKQCKFHPHNNHLEGKEVDTDLCVICQVEYEVGESVVALPCDHPYHSDCVTKWLQINKICPICSSEVAPPKKFN